MSDTMNLLIETKLLKLRRSYDLGEETYLSDQEYDDLVNQFKQIDPTNHFFYNTGTIPEFGTKVTLEKTMGSLNQLKDEFSISKWAKSIPSFLIAEKLDGVSLQLIYQNGHLKQAQTRGDGHVGIDVTPLALKVSNIPNRIESSAEKDIVRGEIIISKSHFKSISGYKNARNFVAGQVNSKNPIKDFLRLTHFVAFSYDTTYARSVSIVHKSKENQYRELALLGFTIPRIGVCPKISKESLSTLFKEWKSNSLFEIDGIVVDYNNEDFRIENGELNPSYSFKYKENTAENTSAATVVKVHWSPSKDGYLKPRVEIEPIDIGGVTITYATGFNAKFIFVNLIGPGTEIILTRSGDVIPHILEITKPTEPEMPNEVFYWSNSGVDAILLNPKNDPEVKLKNFGIFFGYLGIKGLGHTTIKKWFDDEMTINAMLRCDVSYFQDTVGPNAGIKIHEQIHSALNNLTMHTLLMALQVCGRNNGSSKLKSIYKKYKTFEVSSSEMATINGISHQSAIEICYGVIEAMEFIEENFEYLLIVDPEEPDQPESALFADVSFVFTGVRDKELIQVIQENQGEIWNGIKKGLNFLVAKDPNGNSNKLKKARELGIEILSLEQARSFVADELCK